jgi:hypothetical protein
LTLSEDSDRTSDDRSSVRGNVRGNDRSNVRSNLTLSEGNDRSSVRGGVGGSVRCSVRSNVRSNLTLSEGSGRSSADRIRIARTSASDILTLPEGNSFIGANSRVKGSTKGTSFTLEISSAALNGVDESESDILSSKLAYLGD